VKRAQICLLIIIEILGANRNIPTNYETDLDRINIEIYLCFYMNKSLKDTPYFLPVVTFWLFKNVN